MTNTPRDAAKDKRTNNEAEAFIDLVEALDMWLENRLQAVHTCIPGYIEGYDNVNRRCDVQPSINLPFPDHVLGLTLTGSFNISTPIDTPPRI